MKRITAIIITVLLLVSLVACNGEGNTSSQPETVYPSRTAEFYGEMDMNSFWFTMEFTNNGSTYDFTQATDGKVVTTIEDHSNDSLDKYQLYDKKCIHKLYVNRSYYDTVVGAPGQAFLFEGYTATMFAKPSTSSVKTFEGKSYYCESFATQTMSGSSYGGKNNYYFEEDGRLAVIEITEGSKTVMVMRIKDYSNTIPSDIYLSIPSGFKAGELQYQAPDVSYDDVSDEWGIG